MSKQPDKERVDRRFVPALLARKYMKDYEASLADFPENKRVEFLEHLLECLDIIEAHAANPTSENWKIYADKENAFLKKHGKRLKTYHQKNMYRYYGDSTVLVEKGIYTTDEWNNLSRERQNLNAEEYTEFIHSCRKTLFLDRHFLLLQQTPEDERQENSSKEAKESVSGLTTLKKGKIKRDPQDKKTCLSLEQTVLLIYYLQLERVFLNDEYIFDKDMGTAFEILTGYSQNTLRMNLSESHLQKNKSKINLTKVDKILTRLQIAIGNDLKGK